MWLDVCVCVCVCAHCTISSQIELVLVFSSFFIFSILFSSSLFFVRIRQVYFVVVRRSLSTIFFFFFICFVFVFIFFYASPLPSTLLSLPSLSFFPVHIPRSLLSITFSWNTGLSLRFKDMLFLVHFLFSHFCTLHYISVYTLATHVYGIRQHIQHRARVYNTHYFHSVYFFFISHFLIFFFFRLL